MKKQLTDLTPHLCIVFTRISAAQIRRGSQISVQAPIQSKSNDVNPASLIRKNNTADKTILRRVQLSNKRLPQIGTALTPRISAAFEA